MPPVIVTAALIKENGRVLLSQRYKDAHQGLKWEFPGGKLEEGESPEECVCRELKEELGVDVTVKDFFTAVFHRYSQFDILLLVYRVEIISGSPRPIGSRQLRWVTPEEMLKITMPPADETIREKILSERL
jgi:8-oxo-dGTP diphosphatase